MACKHIEDGYCKLKYRNGYCRKSLMMCGDDSVLFLDDFTKFKLNNKIEVVESNE